MSIHFLDNPGTCNLGFLTKCAVVNIAEPFQLLVA